MNRPTIERDPKHPVPVDWGAIASAMGGHRCVCCGSAIDDRREDPHLADPHGDRIWCDWVCFLEAAEACVDHVAEVALIAAVFGELMARTEESGTPKGQWKNLRKQLLHDLAQATDRAIREVT